MSERKERPDGPSKRPSRPQGPSKSSKSKGADASRAGSSRSGKSRRRSSDASMSRGPRPIVAQQQRQATADPGAGRSGSRRGGKKKKNDNSAMVIAIVVGVVLVVGAGFGSIAWTMGLFGGSDTPGKVDPIPGDPADGWTEEMYKDPYVKAFNVYGPDTTEFTADNKTFPKFARMSEVKRIMGGKEPATAQQQDGSEGTKWVYGEMDMFDGNDKGLVLIFNKYDELVYAYYRPY